MSLIEILKSFVSEVTEYAPKGADCSICTEECSESSIKIRCGHFFHEACLLPWKNTCPNCREESLEVIKRYPNTTIKIERENISKALDMLFYKIQGFAFEIFQAFVNFKRYF